MMEAIKDDGGKPAFMVHNGNGRKFVQSRRGLYEYDAKGQSDGEPSGNVALKTNQDTTNLFMMMIPFMVCMKAITATLVDKQDIIIIS